VFVFAKPSTSCIDVLGKNSAHPKEKNLFRKKEENSKKYKPVDCYRV
jgi:hypothetical protein